MTVFVNCDLVRHAVRRAGPWSRVSDEAVHTPMCALKLRRGHRPTGGLGEPFFRAERVASYKPPGLAGDDYRGGVGGAA